MKLSENTKSPTRGIYNSKSVDKTPILTMMVGLLGAGKSTCLDSIDYGNEKPIIHSSDKLREELFGDVNSQEHNGDLFVELHRRIKRDLKSGKDVIYDATNLSKKRRIAFLNELKNINCKHYCVVVLTPLDRCIKQNANRDRVVPEEVIVKMIKNFQPPAYSEGWDKIILTFNMDDKEASDRWELSKLFHGDYGIDNFPQDNSHHKLTLGMHCRKAYEYVKSVRPDDDRLLIAALLHDEGKILTKSNLNSKGEEDGDCHYYQHHCVGAYDSFFYTLNLGFSEEDMIYIANLIYFHMHPYNEWVQSESVKRRHRIQFGEQFYEDVMLLHEADVSAH
jgi:predicted kinase